VTDAPTLHAKNHLVDASGAGVCIVLTILAWVFVVAPLRQAMRDHIRREQVRMQRSMDANSRADAARAVAARLDELRQQLASYSIALESSSAVNGRVAVLSDLATEYGLDVEMLAVQGTRPGPEYTLVPIQMKGTSEFRSILQFMHALSDKMPNTGISSFALKSEHSNRADVSIDLDLVWYARTDQDPRVTAVTP
jgi:Tfp pilus assembly protein PilO